MQVFALNFAVVPFVDDVVYLLWFRSKLPNKAWLEQRGLGVCLIFHSSY
jgi:hypothetical protein